MLHESLSPFLGHYTGTARTWFKPDELVDSQPIALTGEGALAERFLRLRYSSTLQGKPYEGELLVGYDPHQQRYEASWIDSFHMSRAMLLLTSETGAAAPYLTSTYFAGEGPRWGWHIALVAEGRARWVRMYNVPPEMAPLLGVEFELAPTA